MATKSEAKNNYYEARDGKASDKTDEILEELPAFVGQFVANQAGKNRAALTIKGYVTDIRVFLRFLIEKKYFSGVSFIKDITPEMLSTLSILDCDAFKKYMNNYKKRAEDGSIISVSNDAPGQARKLSAVRSLYTFLFKVNYIEKDRSKRIEMPKIDKKAVVHINLEGISELFDTVNSGEGLSKRQQAYNESFKKRDVAIIAVLLGTGIRESELIGLDFEDVDRRTRVIRVVRKGHKEAWINLPEYSYDALADYMDNSRSKITPMKGSESAVFLSSQRKRLSARALQDLVKKYANAAQLFNASSISVHKLRSTYATELLRASENNLLMVSKNLGHEQLQTTLRYTAEDENNSKNAALKIEKILPSAVSALNPDAEKE